MYKEFILAYGLHNCHVDNCNLDNKTCCLYIHWWWSKFPNTSVKTTSKFIDLICLTNPLLFDLYLVNHYIWCIAISLWLSKHDVYWLYSVCVWGGGSHIRNGQKKRTSYQSCLREMQDKHQARHEGYKSSQPLPTWKFGRVCAFVRVTCRWIIPWYKRYRQMRRNATCTLCKGHWRNTRTLSELLQCVDSNYIDPSNI